MRERQRVGRDGEVLPEPVAAQLLKRAVELDAVRDGERSVAELRAAALEAGISPSAFDAALAELAGAEQTRSSQTPARRHRRTWLVAACIVAVLIALVALFVIRMAVPDIAAVPMVEEPSRIR